MTAALPRIGEDFAGFGLRAVLGRGGMSVVYEAENRRLGSTVALKVLAPELADDDVFRERFLKESRIAASLSHPNVIPIYDVGPYNDLLYIAMRYVHGADLRRVLKAQECIAPDQALMLVGQAGRALDAAHREGLVHRDVKPANFLVERGGADDPDHVYLADFGITKHALSRSGLTATGQFVGTIDYIAPEQIQDRQVDGRADIYSLGCVLYECIAGRVPFAKNLDAAVIWAHVEEMPTAPSAIRPELPHGIDEVIRRALAKDPDDRYSTCREFIAAAHAALNPPQPGSRGATSDGAQAVVPATVLASESAPRSPEPVPGTGTASGPAANAEAPAAAPPGLASPVPSPIADPQGSTKVSEGRSSLTAARSGVRGPAGGEPPPGGALRSPDEQGSAGNGDGDPRDRRSKGAHGPARPIALLAIGLLVIGGAVALLLAGSSGQRSHPKATSAAHPSPILQALARANESITAKGLLPPSACKAESASMVTCSKPAFSINTVTFQTFASLGALYGAYANEVRSLSGSALRTNVGECTPQTTNGEISWNHNYQHPRHYSLAQLQSGKVGDDQAAGRLFCIFSNSEYHLVWTMNDGRLLAMLTGAPHDDAWTWWHGVHHAIDLPGSTSMSSMQMSGAH